MSFLKRRATPIKVQAPWEPILGDAPLPQQVITLPVTNPATNQPYTIAPPDLQEQHPAHAAFFNLALVAADEDRASEHAAPVHCNALEMRLASSFVARAFDGKVQADLRWEGARAVLRVPGVRGAHLHAALAAFNSGRMCVDASNLEPLLWTATALGLERLAAGCAQYLLSRDVIAAAPAQARSSAAICQLAKAVGRADLLAPILEEVRVAFGRLAPAAVAGLLAWLPIERGAALLQADNLQVATELQVAEALLLLPGATVASPPATAALPAAVPDSPAVTMSRASSSALGSAPNTPVARGATPFRGATQVVEQRSALPLWRALRVRTLHRAEIFTLQSRVPALADYKTRLHIMAELNAAWAAEVKRAAGLRSFRRSQARQQEQGSTGVRSPFGAPAAQSPYPSPAHPFGPRAPTRRRHACEDVLFFEVPVSEVEKMASGNVNVASDDAGWTSTPQTLCGQTLRLAIAQVPAAEAAQYILAEADRQSRGASGASGDSSGNSTPAGATVASQPLTTLTSSPNTSGRLSEGQVQWSGRWGCISGENVKDSSPPKKASPPGKGAAGHRAASPKRHGGGPRRDASAKTPARRASSEPPEAAPPATAGRRGAEGPNSRRIVPRSELSLAQGARRAGSIPPPDGGAPCEDQRSPLLVAAASAGTRKTGIPRPPRLEVLALMQSGVENEEEEEDLYAEASWSPSRWDKLRPAATPPAHLHTVASQQASLQRPSSMGSPAPRHVVGLRLLAGGGEDADADAAQVEGGVPVESFDVFCLAQRAEEPEAKELTELPRLLGAFTSYEVPYKQRRCLGCGPADFMSRCLVWRSAISDAGGGSPTVCVGIRVNWGGAGAPY